MGQIQQVICEVLNNLLSVLGSAANLLGLGSVPFRDGQDYFGLHVLVSRYYWPIGGENHQPPKEELILTMSQLLLLRGWRRTLDWTNLIRACLLGNLSCPDTHNLKVNMRDQEFCMWQVEDSSLKVPYSFFSLSFWFGSGSTEEEVLECVAVYVDSL